MRLELTDAAVSDLKSIREYTLETWGEEQEDRYLEAMWNRFETILSNPQQFRFRRDLFPDCQLASQGKHVILFRIKDDALQIVRVLHSAMDFRKQLSDS